VIPQLKDTFEDCRNIFGSERLLIVSNSAGTPLDAGYLAAEALERNLRIPVLRHTAMKPSTKCIRSIRDYFDAPASAAPPSNDSVEKLDSHTHDDPRQPHASAPRLVVIGDRILTDVIMGNHKELGTENMTVLTQTVWAPENLGIRLLRAGETYLSGLISRREEVKMQLKSFSKFTRAADEVLGINGRVPLSEQVGARKETVWEGRS